MANERRGKKRNARYGDDEEGKKTLFGDQTEN